MVIGFCTSRHSLQSQGDNCLVTWLLKYLPVSSYILQTSAWGRPVLFVSSVECNQKSQATSLGIGDILVRKWHDLILETLKEKNGVCPVETIVL